MKLIHRRRGTKNEKAKHDNEGEGRPELDSKDSPHETEGQQHFGYEVEGRLLLGHKLGSDHKTGYKLDGWPHATEMPAVDAPAAELP